MSKFKLSFVSFLGLLVVLSPLTAALANPVAVTGVSDQHGSNIFATIEKSGGKEVDNERLEEERGEYWNVFAAAGAGGIFGAGSYAFNYYTGNHRWSWRGFARSTITGAVAAGTGVVGGMVSTAYSLGSTASAVVSTVAGSIGGFVTNRVFDLF